MTQSMAKILQEHALTIPQYDYLIRSASRDRNASETIPRTRHVEHGLVLGVSTTTIHILLQNGYISSELVHSPDEIDRLTKRKTQAIEQAKQELNEDKWLEALGSLRAAHSLNQSLGTRALKLTPKALAVLEKLGGSNHKILRRD